VFAGRGFEALKAFAAAVTLIEDAAHASAGDSGARGRGAVSTAAFSPQVGHDSQPRIDEAQSVLGRCLLSLGAPKVGQLCFDQASNATRDAYEKALHDFRAAQAREDALTNGNGVGECPEPPSAQQKPRSQRSGSPQRSPPPLRGRPRSSEGKATSTRGDRGNGRSNSPPRQGSPKHAVSPSRRPRSPSPASRAAPAKTFLSVDRAAAAVETVNARKTLRVVATAFGTAELGAGRCLAAMGDLEAACNRLETAASSAAAAGVSEPPLEAEARLDLARLFMRLGRPVAASSQLDACLRLRPAWRQARVKRAALRLSQREPALCLADIAAIGGGIAEDLTSFMTDEARLRAEALIALGRLSEAQTTIEQLGLSTPLLVDANQKSEDACSSPEKAPALAPSEPMNGVMDEVSAPGVLGPQRMWLCTARAFRARGLQQDAMPWLDAAMVALSNELSLARAAIAHEDRERARIAALPFQESGIGEERRLQMRDIEKVAREEATRMAERPPAELLLEREKDVRQLLIAAHGERGRCLHELHQAALAIDAYSSALDLVCDAPYVTSSPSAGSPQSQRGGGTSPTGFRTPSPGKRRGAASAEPAVPITPLEPRGPLLFLRASALYSLREWCDAEIEARASLAAEWIIESDLAGLSLEQREAAEEKAVRNQAAAQQLLGLALARRGELWPSITAFSASLDLFPDSPDTLLQRASVLLLCDRAAAAAEDCSRALELRPGWMIAHHRRGHAFAALRWFEEAANELEIATANSPNFAVNYHAIGALEALSLDALDEEWTPGGSFLSFWDYGVAQQSEGRDLLRRSIDEGTGAEGE